MIVKLKHSDPRYGDFKRLRALFTNKIMRHDTKAIKDLCSVCRYLQRGHHDFLHQFSRPGCFYWHLMRQNQVLVSEPVDLPPEPLKPELTTSLMREELVKYLYDLWLFHGYTDSAAVETEQLTIKQQEFSRVMSMPSYEAALTTAGKMFKAACQSITYQQHLLEYHHCTTCMESVDMDSKQFFEKWCKAQDVDAKEFLLNSWKVLTKKEPKKANLFLYGKPDSGKTWMVNSLLNGCQVANLQISEQSQFDWQEALDRQFIHIGEITISERNIDMIKKIFSGESCMVNRKYQGFAELKRRAIFVDSNYVPWRFVNSEKEALEARCFMYNFLFLGDSLQKAACV